MENKTKGDPLRGRRTPRYRDLRRMALLRLQERLAEDRLSVAELLKVIAGDVEEGQPSLPAGDWVLALSGDAAKGGDDGQSS